MASFSVIKMEFNVFVKYPIITWSQKPADNKSTPTTESAIIRGKCRREKETLDSAVQALSQPDGLTQETSARTVFDFVNSCWRRGVGNFSYIWSYRRRQGQNRYRDQEIRRILHAQEKRTSGMCLTRGHKERPKESMLTSPNCASLQETVSLDNFAII